MGFVVENWYVVIGIIALVSVAAIMIFKFVTGDTKGQLQKIREWLLYATTEAEKALGSGTGQLKLRYVYDMFVTKFTWMAKIISFEQFSELVDEALEKMNNLLDTNEAVQTYVNVTKE